MFVTSADIDVPLMTVVTRKGYGLGAQAMAGGGFKATLYCNLAYRRVRWHGSRGCGSWVTAKNFRPLKILKSVPTYEKMVAGCISAVRR